MTCGPGTRTRNRCMNTRAGRNCSAQTGQCEKPSCLRTNLNRYNYNMNNINNYNRWSEWTACPCGGGKRSRTKGGVYFFIAIYIQYTILSNWLFSARTLIFLIIFSFHNSKKIVAFYQVGT